MATENMAISLTPFSISPHLKCSRLPEHVWSRMSDMLLHALQGLARRKNKLPVGGVMVMLFVPLAVVLE